MTDTLDTQIRVLVTELMDSAPQAPSLSELEWRESQMATGVQRPPRVRYRLSSRRPGILVALGAVVAVCATTAGLAATGPFGPDGRTNATNPAPASQLTAFDKQKVISAVFTANQDQILSETKEFVNASGQIVNAMRVLVDNADGNAVLETFSASGSPADALVFDSGSVTHIDYAKQAWWTVTTAGAGSPTLQVPESTASGVQSLVTSGQLRVVSSTELNGQRATELVGHGVLPGSNLTLWISEATDLPIRAIGTQSDGSQQITTYQWLDRNDQNLSLVTPTVPSGFTHLSGPPPGDAPASPLG